MKNETKRASSSVQLTQSDTERERKTAKKITDCIMRVLKFWRLCKKKPKKRDLKIVS